MTVTNGDNADKSTTTGVDGSYNIDKIKLGNYRLIIEAEGFFTRIVSDIIIDEGENFVDQQIIVQTPEGGSFRIVLIWGENPNDLDSHLTGPNGDGSRFHVYFYNKYNVDNSVNLGVDDTYSYGPETVTILGFKEGTYRYSIYNYSDQTSTGGTAIYSSPARVEVYDASGIIESFDAPVCSISANTWRVFEIVVSGNSSTINPINEYVTADYSSDTDIFKSTGVKPAMGNIGF